MSSAFPNAYPFSPTQTHIEQQGFYPFPPEAAPNPTMNTSASFCDTINASAFDPALQQTVMTPGGISQGSSQITEEKDPFMTLLEQLAENEHSRGGPSDLDFFLGDQNGWKQEVGD